MASTRNVLKPRNKKRKLKIGYEGDSESEMEPNQIISEVLSTDPNLPDRFKDDEIGKAYRILEIFLLKS